MQAIAKEMNFSESTFILPAERPDTGQDAAPPAKYLGQGKHTGAYWPTEGWRTCKPEEAPAYLADTLRALMALHPAT
mgnify:CR=1 FL=1